MFFKDLLNKLKCTSIPLTVSSANTLPLGRCMSPVILKKDDLCHTVDDYGNIFLPSVGISIH